VVSKYWRKSDDRDMKDISQRRREVKCTQNAIPPMGGYTLDVDGQTEMI